MRGWISAARSSGFISFGWPFRSTRMGPPLPLRLGIAELRQGGFEVVLEHIRHGDEFDVLVAGEGIDNGLRAAPAAAHDAGAEAVPGGAANQLRPDEGECRRPGGRVPEQGPSGYGVGNLSHVRHDTPFRRPMQAAPRVSTRRPGEGRP